MKEYPFISIAPVDGSILPTITFDSYEGGRLAGEALIDAGFEKFGIITGPMVKWEASHLTMGPVIIPNFSKPASIKASPANLPPSYESNVMVGKILPSTGAIEIKGYSFTFFAKKVKEYPFISIAPVDGSILPTITFDSYEGGRLAGEALIDAGFEKFGIITGPMVKWEANLRKNGFNDVLRKNGFQIEWEYQGDYSFLSGEAALKDIQKGKIRKMGIFSSNDQMALGFLHTALENGMTIPGDFGIVGYDNMPYSKIFYPKLSTISTDLNLLAEATLESIRAMVKSINGKKTSLTTTLLPVEMVKRRTHKK